MIRVLFVRILFIRIKRVKNAKKGKKTELLRNCARNQPEKFLSLKAFLQTSASAFLP